MATSITIRMNGGTRKHEIVRAALETIAEHGIQGATVSRIAARAGITSAALYSHFTNRQAILLAALDVVHKQALDVFCWSSSSDPVRRLTEICKHRADYVRGQGGPSYVPVFLAFATSAAEEGLGDAVKDRQIAATSIIRSIAEEMAERGMLAPDLDPESAAWLIASWVWAGDVAICMGLGSIWHDRVSPRLLGLILRGLTTGHDGPAESRYPSNTDSSAHAVEAGDGSAESDYMRGVERLLSEWRTHWQRNGGPGWTPDSLPVARPGKAADHEAPRRPAGTDTRATADGLSGAAVYTMREAAEVLKITPEAVADLVADGTVFCLRIGGEVRIPRRALLAFLRGITVDGLDNSLEIEAVRS